MKAYLQRKLFTPLLNALRQGTSPAGLAFAVSVGLAIAAVPVFGICTLLCLLAVRLWRLNAAVLLLVNQLAYPLQFVLYLPWLRAGNRLFGRANLPFSAAQLLHLVKTAPIHTMKLLWVSTLYGLVAWALVTLPIVYGLYFIFKALFAQLLRRQQKQAANTAAVAGEVVAEDSPQ